MNEERKFVIAITGASGSLYARILLQKLQLLLPNTKHLGLIMSNNAKEVWAHELGIPFENTFGATLYEKFDFTAPFASGSSKYESMVIIPCSMGALGRIANGVSDDLVTRTADVMLKERRRLILVVRENPYNQIHLQNMLTITQAGGIICPATPSFYSKPSTVAEVAQTVVDRVIDLLQLNHQTYRWGS